jgi:dTDP-4-dehydrorhamnose 3,5-epimerase
MLGIEGAFEITPEIYADTRGSFQEWFNMERIRKVLPFNFIPVQGNISYSNESVVRGIHFSNSSSGQEKLVTCISGEIRDILIDLRLGSPSFMKVEYISLLPTNGNSVFIPSGVGHGFSSMKDDSILCYLLSSTYDPTTEQSVNPFDAELALDWNVEKPILSDRDVAGLSFQQVSDRKLLINF